MFNCGGSRAEEKRVSSPEPAVLGNARYTDDGRRIITIGTWYDRYYVSRHHDIHDDANMADEVSAQMRLAKIRAVEEKYNIVLDSVNLTFEGVEESINSSIPAGSPDVDIYEVDLQFGIPAVLKGYAVSLQEMGLQGTDVFGTQMVMKCLNISNQQETCLFAPSNTGAVNAYVLAFNMDLIRAAGLPNPQDLYDRGQWTWERWREYLRTLTRDTDGDGAADIYGYSGYWTHLLSALLLSNNTGIAPERVERLSSPRTREVLEMINTIYNVDKSARPWDHSNWEINNRLYAEGLSGFWIGADWIFGEQGGSGLPFEIGVVPWPRGPHGSFTENRHSQPQGNWYFIPKGAEDPRLIYDVIYDWTNWYDGDLTRGLTTEWSRKLYMTDRNFQYALMMASKPGIDLWESLETGFNLVPLISAEVSPDELIAEYRQPIQDALDNYFK
ncbi:MAG: ABC transporter substrate-binding protein [Treponema sp.]|nr:ABC transporter substrate-binding protein [Treponema sp.]